MPDCLSYPLHLLLRVFSAPYQHLSDDQDVHQSGEYTCEYHRLPSPWHRYLALWSESRGRGSVPALLTSIENTFQPNMRADLLPCFFLYSLRQYPTYFQCVTHFVATLHKYKTQLLRFGGCNMTFVSCSQHRESNHKVGMHTVVKQGFSGLLVAHIISGKAGQMIDN